MTSPTPETLEREKNKLWVLDSELIRRLGVPEKLGYEMLRILDAKGNGFPRKEKLWGKRRYWPAVKDYFDRQHGLRMEASPRRERA